MDFVIREFGPSLSLRPCPLWYKRFLYWESWFTKLVLISRSGLLEFKNSSVFKRLQRYYHMMQAAIMKHALF